MHRLLNRRVLLAVVALAALLPYLSSLGNGFALDDVPIIRENPNLHDVGNWRLQWLVPYWPTFGTQLGLYRPLASWGYALQWAATGGEPWLFHTVNVLLHVATSVLAFALLQRLGFATLGALAGALVFAVHPVHTEAVANIVGQAELIAAAATLAACLVHASRPDTLEVSWPRRLALLALFLCAILAKENAVVLPALLLLCDVAQRRVLPTRESLQRYAHAIAMPLAVLLIGFGVYLVVRIDVLGSITGADAGPTLPFLREEHRLYNAFRAVPELLRLLFFPLRLSSDYSPAVILPTDQWTAMSAAGALVLAAIAAAALLVLRHPHLAFPAAWFVISIITVSNIFFPIGVLVAERTLYLPSFAVSALVAALWPLLATRATVPARRFTIALFALLLLAGAARTWVRNPDWKDTAAVQTALARDIPESYRSQWILGSHYWATGDLPRAALHFAFAHRIYPRDSQFLTEYGIFLLAQNRPEEGLQVLRESVALHDFVPRSRLMLAYAWLANGRGDRAIPETYHAYSIGSAGTAALPILAHAYEQVGRPLDAVAAWRAVLQRFGGDISHNWSWYARALARAGMTTDALEAADRAERLARGEPVTTTQARNVRTAIASGCYRSADPAGCDPLSNYFGVGTPAQNAVLLQNASAGSPAGSSQ